MATVRTEVELRFAIQSGTDPEVLVANDITVRTYTTVNRSVTIRTEPGNPTATLFWSPASGMTNQYLFVVRAGGDLKIDTLTMDGQGRNCGLVKLIGGTYTMDDGATMTGIKSNTSNSAVYIGEMTSTAGGTFNMHGGLITGADAGPHAVVFCAGGTIVMDGNAAIDNNPSEGITAMHSVVDGTRSNVRITGNARITNNNSGQSGAGLVLLNSDAVIGENEDDAPIIGGNYSPYHAGGILVLEEADLTIGGRTLISSNSALLTAGGIGVSTNSILQIGGNAKVTDNKCGASAGGMNITTNSVAVLEDDVEISGNIAGDETIVGGAGTGSAGGVLVQTGASLEIKGNVAIRDNTAENGGGIYLATPPTGSTYAPPTVIIGAEDSSPFINSNTAADLGGGIFIGEQCAATLTGQASVFNNNAADGKGVYNAGEFNVAGSPKVIDGLFFDCVPADSYSASVPSQPIEKFRIESYDPDYTVYEYDILLDNIAKFGIPNPGVSPFADSPQPLQCDKAPVIYEALTAEAEIHVESSGHVTRPNVPLVIAQGGGNAIPLTETDRAAWRIPEEFDPGYAVMLTSDLEQVIIDAVNYDIVYEGLFGSTNPNPASYKINGLPVGFAPPGGRKGYTFLRWRDLEGNTVTEIPEGSTGNLTLIAVWQADVYNIDYQGLFGTTHPNPPSYSIDDLPIQLAVPSARRGYAFVGWRDASGNPATEIQEDSTGDLVFTAEWQLQFYNIVYYNLFGDTFKNPASYCIVDLPIQLAAPSERTGYTFVGWRDTAGNIVMEIPEGTVGDLEFTAVWQDRDYNIVYRGLSGATHPNPTSYSIESLPILLAAPSERPGYTFVGWRDAAGNLVTEIPEGTEGDLTFTAVWQARVYNIIYNDLFGAAHTNPASYSSDGLPIPLAAPSARPGYVFIGWRDAAGNHVSEIPEGSIGDLAFTAVWAELFLYFDGNDICVYDVPGDIRAENGVARIPCIKPHKPCHVFLCWNEHASGSEKSYCPGEEINISGKSVTLYAQWKYVGCRCR